MNDLRTLQRLVRAALDAIEDDVGEVVYGPASSLRRGKFYVLGLNPGGEGQLSPTGTAHTVGSHLGLMLDRSIHSVWDEDWIKGMEPDPARFGAHRYQRGLAEILRRLGVGEEEKRQVFTSNLIFTTTPTAAHLRDDFEALAELCWAAHELFLDVVRPEVVICVGNGGKHSAYGWVLAKLASGAREERFRVIGHQVSTYVASGTLGGRQVKVLGLPHLSRFNVAADAVKWAAQRAS